MGCLGTVAVRWRPHVRDVDFTYVTKSCWERLGNWAQVDSTLLLAPQDADVYVTVDADTLPVSDLEAMLQDVLECQSIAGVIAHYPPPPVKNVAAWQALANSLGVKPPECTFSYSLLGEYTSEEVRRAPIYYNGGVVFFARAAFERFLAPYIATREKLTGALGEWSDFSGQVAMTFAISEARVPAKTLPMRYNYPNDDQAILLHPGEIDNVVVFHYLRRQVIDRHTIFVNKVGYNAFLGAPLAGTNLAFQSAVRRIFGTTYPF